MAKADVLRRVRQNLFGGPFTERPFIQEVTAFNNVTTTITVSDGTAWTEGDILEAMDTGEQMYVTGVATNNLTVIRGFNGTSAASSTSTPPHVRKNPQFTEQEILDQYDHILNSLWSHGVGQWVLTPISPLQAENPQLVEVLNLSPWQVVSVAIQSTNDAADEIHVPFRTRSTGNDVQIRCFWPHETDFGQQATLLTFQKLTDLDTEDTHPEVEQALEDGVTYRLMASTMASRLHDPGKYTDRTVQPGQGGRDARFYQGEYVLAVRRISQEQKVDRANRRVGQDYGTSRARRWRV